MQTIDEFVQSLKYDAKGLIPAVLQDYTNKDVLMVAYMNAESLTQTLKSGKATYFSRSRNKLWLKGETSGHYQHVKEITFDCDRDTLLIAVDQMGVACHEGYRSCFFREVAIVDSDKVEERLCARKPE